MKTLLLMRHAKSSWKDQSLEDYQRPLKKRGVKDAREMRQRLLDKKLFPTAIISSGAARASQTAETLTEDIEEPFELVFSDELYMAEVEDLLAAVHSLADTHSCAMLVGHNPGLECLLQMLSNEIESLPTAAIAVLELPIDSWQAVKLDCRAHLSSLLLPKRVKTAS